MKLTFDPNLFGLERRDLIVYEAMLANQGASSVRTIAAQVSMNRGTTFEIIKKLVNTGLVSGYYRGTRRSYQAEPPEVLERLAEERQEAVRSARSGLDRYVSDLRRLHPQAASGPFGKHYEGEEEIAVLLHDVLATVSTLQDKTYRVISSAEVSNHMYGKFRNFTRRRIKLRLFVRVIGVGKEGDRAELSDRKMLTAESVPASYIIIYGDKVAQITLTSIGNVQGSIIEDAGIAELQRLLFDRLWDSL